MILIIVIINIQFHYHHPEDNDEPLMPPPEIRTSFPDIVRVPDHNGGVEQRNTFIKQVKKHWSWHMEAPRLRYPRHTSETDTQNFDKTKTRDQRAPLQGLAPPDPVPHAH